MTRPRPEGEVHVWVCPGPQRPSEALIARTLAHYRAWDAAAYRLVRSANRKIHVLGPTGPSPIHVNVSRAGNMAICAVSGAGPIGADIESLARADWMGLQQDWLAIFDDHDADDHGAGRGASLLANWVRMEAAHKAAGVGLLAAPSPSAADPANEGWRLHQVNGAPWRSYCAPLAATHLLGVAVPADAGAVRVRVMGL